MIKKQVATPSTQATIPAQLVATPPVNAGQDPWFVEMNKMTGDQRITQAIYLVLKFMLENFTSVEKKVSPLVKLLNHLNHLISEGLDPKTLTTPLLCNSTENKKALLEFIVLNLADYGAVESVLRTKLLTFLNTHKLDTKNLAEVERLENNLLDHVRRGPIEIYNTLISGILEHLVRTQHFEKADLFVLRLILEKQFMKNATFDQVKKYVELRKGADRVLQEEFDKFQKKRPFLNIQQDHPSVAQETLFSSLPDSEKLSYLLQNGSDQAQINALITQMIDDVFADPLHAFVPKTQLELDDFRLSSTMHDLEELQKTWPSLKAPVQEHLSKKRDELLTELIEEGKRGLPISSQQLLRLTHMLIWAPLNTEIPEDFCTQVASLTVFKNNPSYSAKAALAATLFLLTAGSIDKINIYEHYEKMKDDPKLPSDFLEKLAAFCVKIIDQSKAQGQITPDQIEQFAMQTVVQSPYLFTQIIPLLELVTEPSAKRINHAARHPRAPFPNIYQQNGFALLARTLIWSQHFDLFEKLYKPSSDTFERYLYTLTCALAGQVKKALQIAKQPDLESPIHLPRLVETLDTFSPSKVSCPSSNPDQAVTQAAPNKETKD